MSGTRAHDWVRYLVQAVDVIVDPITEDCFVVDPPDDVIGEQIGCTTCGQPLTDSSAVEDCMGEDPSL